MKPVLRSFPQPPFWASSIHGSISFDLWPCPPPSILFSLSPCSYLNFGVLRTSSLSFAIRSNASAIVLIR